MRPSANENTAIRSTEPDRALLIARLMWVKRRYCSARVPMGLLNRTPAFGV